MEGLLVSTIFVGLRGRPDHVSGARLTDALGHEFGDDGDVGDIAGVDESARS